MTRPKRRTLNDLDGKEWVKSTKSWFVVNPRPRSQTQLKHPAKFPEELVQRFVNFFTNRGDWVFDPFAGVGSTLIASRELGRNSVGIELNNEYVQTAIKHLSTVGDKTEARMLQGDASDAKKILKSEYPDRRPLFDYMITSPPYWDMLRKSRGGNDTTHKERQENGLPQFYSDSVDDLGNIQDYENYLERLVDILSELGPWLKNGAYITVIVQNIRDPEGVLRPLAWDLGKSLSTVFNLRQEMIWCQDNKRLGCWGYPTTYVSNVHHHYCLIFQNP